MLFQRVLPLLVTAAVAANGQAPSPGSSLQVNQYGKGWHEEGTGCAFGTQGHVILWQLLPHGTLEKRPGAYGRVYPSSPATPQDEMSMLNTLTATNTVYGCSETHVVVVGSQEGAVVGRVWKWNGGALDPVTPVFQVQGLPAAVVPQDVTVHSSHFRLAALDRENLYMQTVLLDGVASPPTRRGTPWKATEAHLLTGGMGGAVVGWEDGNGYALQVLGGNDAPDGPVVRPGAQTRVQRLPGGRFVGVKVTDGSVTHTVFDPFAAANTITTKPVGPPVQQAGVSPLDGGFLVVWGSSVGLSVDFWGLRCTADGAPVGEPFPLHPSRSIFDGLPLAFPVPNGFISVQSRKKGDDINVFATSFTTTTLEHTVNIRFRTGTARYAGSDVDYSVEFVFRNGERHAAGVVRGGASGALVTPAAYLSPQPAGEVAAVVVSALVEEGWQVAYFEIFVQEYWQRWPLEGGERPGSWIKLNEASWPSTAVWANPAPGPWVDAPLLIIKTGTERYADTAATHEIFVSHYKTGHEIMVATVPPQTAGAVFEPRVLLPYPTGGIGAIIIRPVNDGGEPDLWLVEELSLRGPDDPMLRPWPVRGDPTTFSSWVKRGTEQSSWPNHIVFVRPTGSV